MKALPCGLLLSVLLVAGAAGAEPLAFRIDEGQNINLFLRDGPVAAHVLLRGGAQPRILVVFPAGNSGTGLWFAKPGAPVAWRVVTPPRPLTTTDGRRRPLHGVVFEIESEASELRPRAAVLSSVRVLRDYELSAQAPAEVLVAPGTGDRITWARDRLDGAAGYRLVLSPGEGTRASGGKFAAAPGKPLRLRVEAVTGEPPLRPLQRTFTADATADERARNALSFLSYEDKFLAGSWRFDTYFGRDTLISALLLAPVLEPDAIESAIASVLVRLAPNGEVAHEEDIGEFAVLRNAREGRGRRDTPIYDYGMVDDDFLLAPLAAHWLLDDARGRDRARAFLAGHGPALARNLRWIVERAAAFSGDPRAANLVGIKDGRNTGQWRDSEQGLGMGRYAYDVNAALVPAALDAVARLQESGLLETVLDAGQKRALAGARGAARVWAARAPALFAVSVPASQARRQVAAYAREIGVDDARAVSSIDGGALDFHALSLDGQGRPIPIVHSDEGFRLLLTDPPAEDIVKALGVLRPFPAGLLTDAGVVVANPALANENVRREFSRFAYHGTVIWSWQQALFAAGLERQLRRDDLPAGVRARLLEARATVWAAIEQTRELRTSELWSWAYSNGRIRPEPFGRPGADVDESNAAQLWSTVFLGLASPAVRPD